MNAKCLRILTILSMMLALILSGCSTMEHLDGSSQKEITDFKSGKSVPQRLSKGSGTGVTPAPKPSGSASVLEEKLKKAKEDLKKKEAEKAELDRQEIQRQKTQIDSLNMTVSQLQGQVSMLKADIENAKTAPTVMAQEAPAPAAAGGNRIKVLAGNGRLISAQKMAMKLKSKGHKVERVDMAPKDTFKSTIIYYAKDSKALASTLAGEVGGKLKPLTWKSVFDIIIVTGGND